MLGLAWTNRWTGFGLHVWARAITIGVVCRIITGIYQRHLIQETYTTELISRESIIA